MYTSLRRRYLVAPDGRWASDCSPDDQSPSSPLPLPAPGGPEGEWDPLSLDGQSPWKTWFAHQDLRATIRQDVDRTFPDIDYFRIERVRRMMVTMLFLFAVQNPDVGYRQVSLTSTCTQRQWLIAAGDARAPGCMPSVGRPRLAGSRRQSSFIIRIIQPGCHA